ncbi:hypothetical protein BJY04DRAFT_214278 [Aspergillus karnatakaensis]|uniref:uncharacterized protein n=1 Tax=Aspergillus karnatakaensis TaxID=1810916 RepID=UPI003CCDCE76
MYFTKFFSATTLLMTLAAAAPTSTPQDTTLGDPTEFLAKLESLSANLKNFCGASDATTTTFDALWNESIGLAWGEGSDDLDGIWGGFLDANKALQAACVEVTAVLDSATPATEEEIQELEEQNQA